VKQKALSSNAQGLSESDNTSVRVMEG